MSHQLISILALALLLAAPVFGQNAPTQPRSPDEPQNSDSAMSDGQSGDRIVIPLGQQNSGSPSPLLPGKGISTSAVERQFGEPLNQSGGVGNPNISVWEYAEFAVYFENDRVLHSVLRHRPATPEN